MTQDALLPGDPGVVVKTTYFSGVSSTFFYIYIVMQENILYLHYKIRLENLNHNYIEDFQFDVSFDLK